MIAIDTNILVRWITGDDQEQCAKVAALFLKNHGTGQIFISDVVLTELEWVLSSVYHFDRQKIGKVLELMLKTRQFSFRKAETVKAAVSKYMHVNRDFSDCLIGESGHEFHRKTYTFDTGLKNDDNFNVIR